MSNVISNISGTTSNKFSIGKRGSSVISGDVVPSSEVGNEGDIYVLRGSAPKIYQKSNEWVEVGTKHIQTVTANTTIDCKFPVEVVLCNASVPITITLDTTNSANGYTVIIKDISNGASSNPITVTCDSLQLIDSGTNATIASNMGVISMLFDGEDYWKV